jgi:hypothetical protein
MQFITDPECEAFFARLGIARDGLVPGSRGAERYKTLEVLYPDPVPIAARVSKSIAAEQGNFSSCLVWCTGIVFGDKGLEANPPPQWKAYYRWRHQMGEPRILYDEPGHLFEPDERDELARVVAWSMCLRWEALIAARPSKFAIGVCHDDFFTIYWRSTPSGLLDDLRKLGLEPRRPALRRG